MPGRTVYTSIWDEEWFSTLLVEARYLLFYFMTCPLGTPSGLFRLLPGVVSAHTKLKGKRLERALAEIAEEVCYDSKAGVVWIKDFLRVHGRSPLFLKAALRDALNGPELFRDEFFTYNRDLLGALPGYPSDGVSNGYRKGIDTPTSLGSGLGIGLGKDLEKPLSPRGAIGEVAELVNLDSHKPTVHPMHCECMAIYQEGYRALTGEKPLITGGDGKLLSRVLRSHSDDPRWPHKVRRVIEYALSGADDKFRTEPPALRTVLSSYHFNRLQGLLARRYREQLEDE